MATPLAPLYISHGSPMIAIEPSPTQKFLKALGPAIDAACGRPRAVLVMSAHTMARGAVLLGASRHHTIHDFGGFPPALYELRYDAPGDPAVAQLAQTCLAQAGFEVPLLDEGGLDHGIWTALMHMWPQADIPVVPLSLPASASPEALWRMGQALKGLPSDVQVIGTGSLTHNLRRVFGSGRLQAGLVDMPEDPESAAFRQWVLTHATAGDWPALWDYRRQAPYAVEMHPTDEHWRPFYLAAGAGASQAAPEPHAAVRLHEAVEFGCLALDAYAFGPGAAPLKTALLTARSA
ncbi:MAG: DODA-type extradiol aromatic ring-opening family dioxygenase [Pseudomonadota bacterium]